MVAIDVLAYFAGLIYWYGPVMSSPDTPMWTWPFIPDCPLFGLLGGMALLMVVGRNHWGEPARRRAQVVMVGFGVLGILLWLSGYLPMASRSWQEQGAMFAVFGAALLLCGSLFQRAPVWLLSVIAAGQIKYGVWTITAWLLFWRNTDALFGYPAFTFDSILMTISHIGLVAQGILLLTYFRPNVAGAIATLVWFGASDIVDYGPKSAGLGWYPGIPEIIPLAVLQWSTIAMTWLLSLGFLIVALPSHKESDANLVATATAGRLPDA
jgi:uncharacterized membrane protein YpjA